MVDSTNTGLKKAIKPDIEKLLSDPKNKIELHKLVQAQTESAYKSIENFECRFRTL